MGWGEQNIGDASQFRGCPIIRYFAKLDAYFRYNVLSVLLFVVILNCETASLFRAEWLGLENDTVPVNLCNCGVS